MAARSVPSATATSQARTRPTAPNGAASTMLRWTGTARRWPAAPPPPPPTHNDTLALERLFLAALAVMVRIRAVFADKSYDARQHRDLCRRFGAEPHVYKRGQPCGSGLGQRRWPVERNSAWLLENKRLAL